MSVEALIGTWKLRSFEMRFPDGRVIHPYGEEVEGLLVYDRTGHMIASLASARRSATASQDLEEVGARTQYDDFMSYCGRYEVKGDRVSHDVLISSLEAWTGTVQERVFERDGDQLSLITLPLLVGGEAPTAYLIWDRIPEAGPDRA